MLLLVEELLSVDSPEVVAAAGLRWLDCEEYPVLPVEAAGRLADADSLSAGPCAETAV